MIEGTKVSWTTASGTKGSGVVIELMPKLHVLVAVDASPGEEHRVIYCAETWLVIVEPSNG